MSEEFLLVDEIWLLILTHLKPKDLCNVALVCWDLYRVASTAKLWKNCNISKVRLRDEKIYQFTGISRFQSMRVMDLSQCKFLDSRPEETNALLQHVVLSFSVVDLNLEGINLSRVSSSRLSRTSAKLRRLNLKDTTLTPTQCTSLFTEILKYRGLKFLCLHGVNLTSVAPVLISSAVCRINQVDLGVTKLTADQITAILYFLVNNDGNNLVDFNIFGADLNDVDDHLLSTAVSGAGLERVVLSWTRLSCSQARALLSFTQVSLSLTTLDLRSVNLSGVEGDSLARAVCRVKEADIGETRLGKQQISGLLQQSLNSTSLLILCLRGLDLSSILPSLLSSAVSRLASVDLTFTRCHAWAPAQCGDLLQGCLSSKVLREMKLVGSGLDRAPRAVMDMAVCRFNL